MANFFLIAFRRWRWRRGVAGCWLPNDVVRKGVPRFVPLPLHVRCFVCQLEQRSLVAYTRAWLGTLKDLTSKLNKGFAEEDAVLALRSLEPNPEPIGLFLFRIWLR